MTKNSSKKDREAFEASLITKFDINPKLQLKERQLEFLRTITANTISVGRGPAGTAKTFIACYCALHELIDGKVSKIIITKPVVESGENLGFLPGDMAEKMNPYIDSYIQTFAKIIGHEKTKFLISKEIIQIKPMAYMLGATFDNAFMILDEAQNTSLKQIMLFATRMGNKSKIVIIGDTRQSYIGYEGKGMDIFADHIINDTKQCGIFNFLKSDIVRNELLIKIVDNYELYLDSLSGTRLNS